MHFNRLPGKWTFILGLIADRVEQDGTKRTGMSIGSEETVIKNAQHLGHYQGIHVSSLLTCSYLFFYVFQQQLNISSVSLNINML